MTSNTTYSLQLLLTQAVYQSIFILLQSPLIDLNGLSVSGDPNKFEACAHTLCSLAPTALGH